MVMVSEASGFVMVQYFRRKLSIVTESNGPKVGRNLEWVLNILLLVDAPRQIGLPATEETFDLLYARNVDGAGHSKEQDLQT